MARLRPAGCGAAAFARCASEGLAEDVIALAALIKPRPLSSLPFSTT